MDSAELDQIKAILAQSEEDIRDRRDQQQGNAPNAPFLPGVSGQYDFIQSGGGTLTTSNSAPDIMYYYLPNNSPYAPLQYYQVPESQSLQRYQAPQFTLRDLDAAYNQAWVGGIGGTPTRGAAVKTVKKPAVQMAPAIKPRVIRFEEE